MKNIIFLNGVSSSGKSTLAKALQEALPEPYCLLSVDNFLNTMHEKFLNAEHYATIFRAVGVMHRTIRVFADAGLPVIVDHVLERQDWLTECVNLLHGYSVLFVRVTCPVEELRRREKARGDRDIGQGESQLAYLCPKDGTYDITVDTCNSSIEECVRDIMALLEEPRKPRAFETLWARYNAQCTTRNAQ
ncbi:MAG: chloramphenicol phosphotransferase CPT family protein [Clostridiales bacterium]|nr:chloramphenicol phosphotransferase CPT family protein [Clostridiales bacterium]